YVRNPMTGLDLIAASVSGSYNRAVRQRTFRQKVGDRLLLEREQVRRWSRSKAAIEAHVADGTIRAIEQGQNAGWDYFERYAKALGLTFDAVCREVLQLSEEIAGADYDADELAVLKTLKGLRDRPD